MKYTHFKANVPSGYFPLYGAITPTSLLVLANNGTTPKNVSEHLRQESERLRTELEAGREVITKTAVITPLTAAQYHRQD